MFTPSHELNVPGPLRRSMEYAYSLHNISNCIVGSHYGTSSRYQLLYWLVLRVVTGVYAHLKAFKTTSECMLSLLWVMREGTKTYSALDDHAHLAGGPWFG
eukprot:3086067-Pleurochrysis_carterae.AAC.7